MEKPKGMAMCSREMSSGYVIVIALRLGLHAQGLHTPETINLSSWMEDGSTRFCLPTRDYWLLKVVGCRGVIFFSGVSLALPLL